MSDLERIDIRLDKIDQKLDSLIVQTTKTNGRVSTHAMVLYPLGVMLLILVGVLLEKGLITMNAIK